MDCSNIIYLQVFDKLLARQYSLDLGLGFDNDKDLFRKIFLHILFSGKSTR
jgi:hypothetical protein